jgi:hypothetical protein
MGRVKVVVLIEHGPRDKISRRALPDLAQLQAHPKPGSRTAPGQNEISSFFFASLRFAPVITTAIMLGMGMRGAG